MIGLGSDKNKKKTRFEEGTLEMCRFVTLTPPLIFGKVPNGLWPPPPCPLERSLPPEIMCMYFVLSGTHTYLHVCIHIRCRQFLKALYPLQHNFPKMRWEGGGSNALSESSSVLVPYIGLQSWRALNTIYVTDRIDSNLGKQLGLVCQNDSLLGKAAIALCCFLCRRLSIGKFKLQSHFL